MTNTYNKNGKCICGSFYQNGHSRGKYSDLEHISTETFKAEKQREQRKKIIKQNKISKDCGTPVRNVAQV